MCDIGNYLVDVTHMGNVVYCGMMFVIVIHVVGIFHDIFVVIWCMLSLL